MSDDGDSENGFDLFKEPEGYRQKEKPPTFVHYTLKDGQTLKLRLIGHSPLWGHLLWNAGQVLARYLEDNAARIVTDKTVLELGAGAGLPSLTAAILGARKVVVTDYPDSALIENLQYNIDNCLLLTETSNIVAEGFLWGSSVKELKTYLPAEDDGFDLLILADILFNHSEHAKLLRTICGCLKRDSDALALVFFTPYRPWLLEKDLAFFQMATKEGLVVEKLGEQVMDKVMFEEDPGDEKLRKTVFSYKIRWKA